jgi:DNA-binding MarR family transcriptional regulator
MKGGDGALPGPSSGPQDDPFLSSTGYLLVQMGRESRRRWVRMLAGHGLSPHQFGILASLAALPSSSQQRLSRIVGLDPRNAVAAFDGLETHGLIDRRTDPADRRSRAVDLTAKGRELTAGLTEAGRSLEVELLAALSEAERTQLRALLGKLYASTAAVA